MIFLDNAGTTKMFEECVDVHKFYSCNDFFNPSALSVESLKVSRLLADTEKFFLDKLGAKVGNILFTGCATESNNMAIKGSLRTGDYEYVFLLVSIRLCLMLRKNLKWMDIKCILCHFQVMVV